MSEKSICGIIVTFNRINKLKKTLESYSHQILKPKYVLVIDNCSSDETPMFLDNWIKIEEGFQKKVLRLSENTGGAGGFSKGMEIACSLDCDWIYIGDDDAYLDEKLFDSFCDRKEINDNRIGAIATTVDSPDGISFFHRRTTKKGLLYFKEIESTEEDYDKENFKINLFSFVGVFLKRDCVKSIALPNSSYFIWYDDSEYSYRFTKEYSAVCIPSLRVFHDCSKESIAFCWKSFYGYRNKLHMLKNDIGFLYYIWFKLLLFISSILDTVIGNKEKGRVKRDAIRSVKRGLMGKNQKYLPQKQKLLEVK